MGWTDRWADVLHRSRLQKRLRDMVDTWWLSRATEIQNYTNANQLYEAVKSVS